jgi:NAD(P)-dependent dehydrogenase (short-subunit alcohol dehydrogenase family)
MAASASTPTAAPAAPAPRRAVLVTGGARRLGREIALMFARFGWDVAVHYGSSAGDAAKTTADIKQLGGRAISLHADLNSERETLALAGAAMKSLGRLDAIVNNASLFVNDTAADFTRDSLLRHMVPNLAAPIILAREFHKLLGETGQGVVINLLDQKLYHYNPDFLSYTLSKAGLQAATVMLAQALAPRVRVIGVAPGLTLPSYLQKDSKDFERGQKLSLTGKSSSPADVAATVLFAAQNQSMTGNVLLVDGGQHLMGLQRDVSFL